MKPALQHFYPNFLLISDKLSWKTSLLIRSKMLGLFFNPLIAYHMYSRQNWEKFPQQGQTKLFSKLKSFLKFLLRFWSYWLRKLLTFPRYAWYAWCLVKTLVVPFFLSYNEKRKRNLYCCFKPFKYISWTFLQSI